MSFPSVPLFLVVRNLVSFPGGVRLEDSLYVVRGDMSKYTVGVGDFTRDSKGTE